MSPERADQSLPLFQHWMYGRRFAFDKTLEAVDRPLSSLRPDPSFPQFLRLPPELRAAIWETFLPDPRAEPPAIICQGIGPFYGEGELFDVEGKVPIRMTTTCAVLLHVNRESRRLVLSWAVSNNYELCFRIFSDRDAIDPSPDEEDEEGIDRNPPIQGPVFMRDWDASKDILYLSIYCIDDNVPEEWNELYTGCETINNVQHVAFEVHSEDAILRSRWFYQLLGAIPALKTVSFEQSGPSAGNGDCMGMTELSVANLTDPWVSREPGSDQPPRRRKALDSRAWARWESVEYPDSDMREKLLDYYKQHMVKNYARLEFCRIECEGSRITGAFDPEWLPDSATIDVHAMKSRERKLPPWIWDHERGDLAFDIRVILINERRGYDDVRGGSVVDIGDIWS